jgi:acyl dehydratase
VNVPINAEKLLRFPIPRGRQTLAAKEIALYALSIGMARDPLDAAELRYVDPLKGPAVMPAMALVMAHPGFWLADPESGVDPTAVLHAAQSLDILGRMPTAGVVQSSTRITGLVDKGAGKPALVLSQTELSDADGAVFARMERTTFIRNGGGFGGDAGGEPRPAAAPQGSPDIVVDLPTSPAQALLYRLNGDLNPLHSDPDLAARAGFSRPILHGLCTMGVVAHALLRALADYDNTRLRGMSLRFASPVLPGETIRTEIWADGSFRARVLERDTVVIDRGRAAIAASGAFR